MAKASDKTAHQVRERIAPGRASSLAKLLQDLKTPPKKLAKLEEAAAKQKEAGRVLDQDAAGLIPPLWAEKLLKPRKPKAIREGARLLLPEQKERGQAQLVKMLNDPKEKTPRRWRLWRTQSTAAAEITKFLGLPKGSSQTVEDQIVIPVFEQRGLREPKK
jgi:hypothetical protein